MEPKWIVFVFTGFVFCMRIHEIDAILCYQCADSNENEDLAPCYHRPRHLLAQRELHEIDGEPLRYLNRLKNCSHYLDDRGEFIFQYCKIEKIEARGVTTAFIRDCSDGRTFGLEVTNLQPLRGDNQTMCRYSQHPVANLCVSICTTDFCNGPSAGSTLVVSLLGLFGTVLAGLYV